MGVKSLIIIIEMMSDSLIGNRLEIRITCLRVEYFSERTEYIMVYVINQDNIPLMPCINVIARLLLKQGKAKCIKRTPFTIKLLYQTANYIQDLTLGIDTGSSKIGSAVVKDSGDVVYLSEVEEMIFQKK